MSLTFASPSARNRVAPRVRPGHSEVSAGRPGLYLVRETSPGHSGRPTRQAGRPGRFANGSASSGESRRSAAFDGTGHAAGSRRSARSARPGRPGQSGRSGRLGRPVAGASALVQGRQQVTSPLRLTRRGRLVVRAGGVLLALAAVLAGVLLLNRTAEAGSVSHQVPVSYHVVLPGETLWQIAGEIAPNTDRRDTVADIIELNALPGAGVSAGQRIALPGN